MSSSAAVCRAGVLLLGDVLVYPVGRVARLVDGDGADRDQERRHDGEEDHVDDEHRRRARHLQSCEVADERVERERDDARGQEQEEDVAERRREQEREDQRNGEDDQLDPPRDLDRRAGAGHRRIVSWSPACARRRPCYGPGDGHSGALPSRCPTPRRSPSSAGPRATPRRRRRHRRARRRHARVDRVRQPELARREPARAAAGDLGASGSARARDGREPPGAVARRTGRRDGDRVPRKRGRRTRPEAGRPAG